MRKTLLSTLAVAVLLGASDACLGQAGGMKPVLTVSFAGYDRLAADYAFLGKLGGAPPNSPNPLDMMVTMMTDGKGLVGLDKSKPWGAVVQTDGQAFSIVGFLPVEDLGELLEALENVVGPAEETTSDLFKIESSIPGIPGGTLYAQQKNGWALIGISAESLATAPAEPLKALGGLEQTYDLAVRASIQNIPAPLRMMLTEQMKLGATAGMPRLPGESDQDYAIRTGVAKQMVSQMANLVNDLDELLLGYAVDESGGTLQVDFQVTAAAGTKTAQQFATVKNAPTEFAGFELPGAALTANWAGQFTDADVAQATAALSNVRTAALKELENQGLGAAEKQLATQLLTDLLDVLQKTVDNKKSDGGLVVNLQPDTATVAAGGAITEGAKLENVLKQLAAEAQKEQPGLAQMLKLDAEKHDGVNFHTLNIPLAALDVDPTDEVGAILSKALGQNLEITVGISGTGVYLAAGRNTVSTLKQVIDKSKSESGKQIPPSRIAVAGTPIAKFVGSLLEPPQQALANQVAATLEQSGGKDHLTVTSTGIPNGVRVRLEVEQGLLQAVGSMGLGGAALGLRRAM